MSHTTGAGPRPGAPRGSAGTAALLAALVADLAVLETVTAAATRREIRAHHEGMRGQRIEIGVSP